MNGLNRKAISLEIARHLPNYFAGKLCNPIFIIGCARSGTSLLTRLISSHKDVANWSEANDIWDPLGYPWRDSDLKTPPIEFDPVAFTSRWWNDTQSRQREIRSIFGAYQWLSRRSVFLNKSPLNTFRIPYLLRIFPTALFIHLVRDGRSVAYSYATKQFETMQAYPMSYRSVGLNYSFDDLAVRLASFWKEHLEEVAKQDELMDLSRNGKLIELTYENLVDDTPAALNRIYQFVGLDPSRFDLMTSHEKIENRNFKWREGLDHRVETRMVNAMEPMLSSKGYA